MFTVEMYGPRYDVYFVSASRAAAAALLYLPVLHLYCLSYLLVVENK